MCTAADQDPSSLANTNLTMIREHCALVGMSIQDKQASLAPVESTKTSLYR